MLCLPASLPSQRLQEKNETRRRGSTARSQCDLLISAPISAAEKKLWDAKLKHLPSDGVPAGSCALDVEYGLSRP